ncbi:MAG: hypothetical protein FWD52_05060 [Candidatus Bathyarchaeota archaeon]|nr:hypothetical protein [Candidatus Termiticorpusculum sp.]
MDLIPPQQFLLAFKIDGTENWLEHSDQIIDFIHNDEAYKIELHHKLSLKRQQKTTLRWLEALDKITELLDAIQRMDNDLLATEAKKQEWRDKLNTAFMNQEHKCTKEYAKFLIANHTLIKILTEHTAEFKNIIHCCPHRKTCPDKCLPIKDGS